LTSEVSFEGCEDHPILQPGMTVQIGLDKNTRLAAVMQRYVDVCNQAYESYQIQVEELEFCHVSLLQRNDTAEQAALMKHDRIKVRLDQSKNRQADQEATRLQRESDQDYLEQLRSMLFDNGQNADLVVECQDNSKIKCHQAMIQKRCPWLARQIQSQKNSWQPPSLPMEEEDDAVMDRMNQPPHHQVLQHAAAAEIENDDEEQAINNIHVVRLGHCREAVQILLEFCYTNRVTSLGQQAFELSCQTKPDPKKNVGPVPPNRRWPPRPITTFSDALAALVLAEEAELPRLSLMCEVAAAQLITSTTVVTALECCETQKQWTGNPLPRLRKAAMDIVLKSSSHLPTNFRQSLQDGRQDLVPTLLIGTMEAIDSVDEKKKRRKREDWQTIALEQFDPIDRQDSLRREQERRKRRKERNSKIDDTSKDVVQRQSLKRKAPQMGHIYRPKTSKSITFRRDSH